MDAGDGRITLAVLGQKIDEVLRRLDCIDDAISEHDRRVSEMERSDARRDEQVHALADDVSRLQTRDAAGTVMSSLLALAAGIVALFGGGK